MTIILSLPAFAQTSTQKLTVMLDWYVNPDHAPLFVAQQQGFYQQQGLDVEFIPPADPTDPPKLVAAGKIDLAIDYQPHLLIETSHGLPVVQVGTLIDSPLSCLAVLENSSINTIVDLKGKNVGYSVAGVDSAILRGMLESNGLKINDVKLVNVKYNLVQGLLSKKIDAAMGLMRNVELIQMQILNQPARAFYPEQNGVPDYSELIFIANKKNKNDPRIAKFLKAVAMGTAYLQMHPNVTWQAFAKNHPELNNQLNQKSWKATLPYFTTNPSMVDQQKCQALAMYLTKMMGENISAAGCG